MWRPWSMIEIKLRSRCDFRNPKWKYLLISRGACFLRYWQNLHNKRFERVLYFPKLSKHDRRKKVSLKIARGTCNSFMLRVKLAFVTNTSLSTIEWQNLITDHIQYERSYDSKINIHTYNTSQRCIHQFIFKIEVRMLSLRVSTLKSLVYLDQHNQG